MALTTENIERLLSDVKTYLNITWNDENKDAQLKMFIKMSAKRLESIYGYSLSFDIDNPESKGYEEAEQIAYDCLLARVFYANEKALDDFESNYVGELLNLRNLGKVRRFTENGYAEH